MDHLAVECIEFYESPAGDIWAADDPPAEFPYKTTIYLNTMTQVMTGPGGMPMQTVMMYWDNDLVTAIVHNSLLTVAEAIRETMLLCSRCISDMRFKNGLPGDPAGSKQYNASASRCERCSGEDDAENPDAVRA